jgi:hypothetical protein
LSKKRTKPRNFEKFHFQNFFKIFKIFGFCELFRQFPSFFDFSKIFKIFSKFSPRDACQRRRVAHPVSVGLGLDPFRLLTDSVSAQPAYGGLDVWPTVALPVSVSALRVASRTSAYRRRCVRDRVRHRQRSLETQYIRDSPTAICPAWHQVGRSFKESLKFFKNCRNFKKIKNGVKREEN